MRVMETRELELKMAMFGIGCSSLAAKTDG